jgi:hypothetical protein
LACEDLPPTFTSPQAETARNYELAKCRDDEDGYCRRQRARVLVATGHGGDTLLGLVTAPLLYSFCGNWNHSPRRTQRILRHENHPTRSYFAARSARTVTFYSLQECGSPRIAIQHLRACITLETHRISEKEISRENADRFLGTLLRLTARRNAVPLNTPSAP